MIKNFIQKFFAPINRWEFVFATFLLLTLTELYYKFVPFFDLYAVSPFNVIILEILIILFIIYKRLYDIFDNVLKSIIGSLVFTILYVVLFFLSYSTMTLSVNNGWVCNNKVVLFLAPIYTVILYLFLLLKKGKNHPANFDWKMLLKRIIAFVIVFVIYKLICSNFYVPISITESYKMYPTIELNDKVLVHKQKDSKNLTRFDLVITKNKDLLRIVGLPNETIKLKNNQVYINDELLKNDYAFYSKNLKQINFDKNSYLLIGDNRYYTKGGKYLTQNKNLSTTDIYQITDNKDIFGKVVVIHYDNYKLNNKYSSNKVERKDISYSFIKKDSKFGFNPGSRLEKIFGKI